MRKLSNILVYHWQAWRGFLISHLVSEYCHLVANYNDTIESIEPALTPNIRAVLLQINLSRSELYPARRQRIIESLQERGLRVLNQHLGDISKANLHDILDAAGIVSAKAPLQGEDNEELFVKSNLNYGAKPELRQTEELQKKLLGKQGEHPRYDQYYRVYRKEIPPSLWHNNAVVIERYIDNPESSFYRVYGFGEALVVVKAHAPQLIKKVCGDPRDSNSFYQKEAILCDSTDMHANLQRTLKRFLSKVSIDYFCLDIVHDLTHFYIIDLNLTPHAGSNSPVADATQFLCPGGYHLIRRQL